jgi:hypothetical protein
MKRLTDIEKMLTDSEFTTKVLLYFASKVVGDDFDPREKNYTYDNLNPITVKGYMREISPESAFWKQYGQQKSGVVEIICSSRYKTWFEIANRITINNIEYETFKDTTGSRVGIINRPYKMIRVTLARKE